MADFSNGDFETNLSSWLAGRLPTDAAVGATGWADASQETAYSDGDPVGTVHDWTETSDWTNSDSNTQATWEENIINGYPVFRTISSAAYGDAYESAAGHSIEGNEKYALIACTYNTVSGEHYVVHTCEGGSSNAIDVMMNPTQNTVNIGHWSGDAAWSSNVGAVVDQWNIGMVGYDQTNRHINNNGSSATNSQSSVNHVNDATRIFGYRYDYVYPNGDVAEIIIINDFDAQKNCYIYSYLALKYSVTLSATGAIITRDTGTTYDSSSGSMKVVTPSSSGLTPVYENINSGTGTLTLTFYAYTDGSEVTVADVKAYVDGTAYTPDSFTSMGDGWYKVEYELTGADSVKMYGAEVQTNKTVYLDDFSIAAAAAGGEGQYLDTSPQMW